MALTDYLDIEEFACQYAVQTDGLNTPATTGWVGLDCTFPQITEEPVVVEQKRAIGARGETTPVIAGRKYYRIAFTCPNHGQLDDYDFTTDSIEIDENGALHFLGVLGGESVIAYAANNCGPVDGNTIALSTSGKDGCLIAFGDGVGGLTRGQGFIQDSATPATTQLFEDMAATRVPVANDERYPTRTLWPGTTQLAPVTFRLLGPLARHDFRFAGCHVAKIVPRDDGDNSFLDVELVAYAGFDDTQGEGGLQYPDDHLKLQPLLARGGARTVVGKNVITALDDGTAGSGTCGLEEMTLSLDFPHDIVRCDEGLEGVEEVNVLSPMITGSLFCPGASSFEVDGENIFKTAYRNRTPISITRYLGDRPGAGFCWKVGAANINKCEWTAVGRKQGYAIDWSAGPYRGDASSNDAGCKPVTIGLS